MDKQGKLNWLHRSDPLSSVPLPVPPSADPPQRERLCSCALRHDFALRENWGGLGARLCWGECCSGGNEMWQLMLCAEGGIDQNRHLWIKWL